jgi:nitronate monooxygenase
VTRLANNRLLRWLDVMFPVLQSPMAGSQDHRLAAAVASAGGLGAIPAAMLDAPAVAKQITLFRSLSSHPVNVNFFCHVMPAFDGTRDGIWRELLHRYFVELGIAADDHPPPVPRRPFDSEYLEVVLDLRPEVLSFHFGLPEPKLLEAVQKEGFRILATATTVREAQFLAAVGVDGIIAQGTEAGGHRGHFMTDHLGEQMDTLSLVQAIVPRVEVPVIAAGGIIDPGSVEAAMAAGASGVQVGTAFLRCTEATTSLLHRAAIDERVIREVGAFSDDAPPFPLAAGAMGELRAAAEKKGRDDFSPLWCGGRIPVRQVASASDLTRELAAAI